MSQRKMLVVGWSLFLGILFWMATIVAGDCGDEVECLEQHSPHHFDR